MNTPLYNIEGKTVGAVELPDTIFGVAWNPTLVHFAILAHRANAREPLAHTKGRGEVRGGGRKPWRQKGTGRARHGSSRSPIWAGGGVSHGPTSERSYTQKINKKQKQAALFSLLSKRLTDGDLKVFESLPSDGQTKSVISFLVKNFHRPFPSAILISGRDAKSGLVRGARNISNIITSSPASLNVYDISSRRQLLMERSAVADFSALTASSDKNLRSKSHQMKIVL